MHYFLIVTLCAQALFSCCDFVLRQHDDVVVGRSMEFGIKMDSKIRVVPAGIRGMSKIEGGPLGMTWVGKYAYFGMSALGMNIIADGMNEKGLSIGALWFPDTEYPTMYSKVGRPEIALVDLSDWILAMFSSVEEVASALNEVYIIPTKVPGVSTIPPLHFSVHDSRGESIVIEFSASKMHVYKNEVGVLTNAPSFPWHVTNLRNYISLQPQNTVKKQFGEYTAKATGQGTGMFGVPGDWTPPSRFIRMATFIDALKIPKEKGATQVASWHILNTVDIPYGCVRSSEGIDYTQWACVKDLQKGVMQYRTYRDQSLKTVRLHELLKKNAKVVQMLPMYGETITE